MNKKEITELLQKVKNDDLTIEDAQKQIASVGYYDVDDFAKIDNHREIRVGYPEVIYCAEKSIEQVCAIIHSMNDRKSNILATRATAEMYTAVKNKIPKANFNEKAGTISVVNKEISKTESYIAIISAGTSDYKVVEEAKETAVMLGNSVKVINDVGVAGIHRLFNNIDVIRGAKVLIVVAGMEGALASVVGGLADKPIIAVPTSVGYGAAYSASMINQL